METAVARNRRPPVLLARRSFEDSLPPYMNGRRLKMRRLTGRYPFCAGAFEELEEDRHDFAIPIHCPRSTPLTWHARVPGVVECAFRAATPGARPVRD